MIHGEHKTFVQTQTLSCVNDYGEDGVHINLNEIFFNNNKLLSLGNGSEPC